MSKISHPNLRKPINRVKFGLSKIRQKLKKNPTDPIFGVTVTTIQMYHCAKFEADPMNDVQNFPPKLILYTVLHTHTHTDRQTRGRFAITIATWVHRTQVAKKASRFHDPPPIACTQYTTNFSYN